MADKQVSYEFNNFESFKMISVRDSWKIKFWFLFIFAIEEGVSELHTMAVSRSQNKVWLQWGSEMQPFEILIDLKSRLLEGQISNDTVFKWSVFSYGYSYGPNHLKTGPFKIWTFLSILCAQSCALTSCCCCLDWLGHIQ